MQFVIDELPTLAVCCAGGIYGGLEDMPFPIAGVAVFLCLLLVLLYRFLCLCRIRYRIGSEQLVCERGLLVRKVDYMELYRVVDFQARPYRHETEGRHRAAHPGTGGIQQTKKGNI